MFRKESYCIPQITLSQAEEPKHCVLQWNFGRRNANRLHLFGPNVCSHWNTPWLGPGNAALLNFQAWEWRSHPL